MSLEIGRIDHDGLRIGPLSGQTFHYLIEHVHFAPPFPTIVQCLVRSVFSERIPPTEAVPVDEDDPVQDPPVINPGPALARGRIWRKARHLMVRKPIQVAHDQSPRGT